MTPSQLEARKQLEILYGRLEQLEEELIDLEGQIERLQDVLLPPTEGPLTDIQSYERYLREQIERDLYELASEPKFCGLFEVINEKDS